MEIFWPGAVIGPVVMLLCLIGFGKREALARGFFSGQEALHGTQRANRIMGDPTARPGRLTAPLLGGMGLGAVFFVLSVTGVLATDGPAAPAPPPGFFLLAAAGIAFGVSAMVYVLTRKGRRPVRALLWALVGAGMACILLAGVLFLGQG